MVSPLLTQTSGTSVPADAHHEVRILSIDMKKDKKTNGSGPLAMEDAHDGAHVCQTRGPMCSVPGCTRPAVYKVMLADWKNSYPGDGSFREQDESCPYLCEEHMLENQHDGKFVGDATWVYPYTKGGFDLCLVEGWTEYERLPVGKQTCRTSHLNH